MSVKAIGFDWGGVILHFPGGNVLQTGAAFLGVEYETFRSAYFNHNAMFNKTSEARRLPEDRELWFEVLKEVGMEAQHEAFMECLSKHPIGVVDQRMVGLVKTLRTQGWKLGLLSNNSITAAKAVRKAGYDQLFDVSLFSGEMQAMKPEPRAFKLLAEGLSVEMEELLFIDDSQRSLSSASDLGYQPILFEGFKQLKEELVKRDLLQI